MARAVIAAFTVLCLSTIACNRAPSTIDRTVEHTMTKSGPEGSTEIRRELCTERPPSYSQSTKAVLDSALRLSETAQAQVLADFTNNVNSFFQNTPEGGDLASTLFYVCQIASNREFGEATTKELLLAAIAAYYNARRDNSPSLAAARVQSRVIKLLRFPEGVPDDSKPPSMIEKMLAESLPRKLFDLLMTYDESDILQVPKIGKALHNHLKNYYRFREQALKTESSLITRIGQMVKVDFKAGWMIYLRYVIARFAGRSKDTVIAGGNFLNYEITWDDAERVFAKLSNDPLMSQEMNQVFAFHKSLIKDVSSIASAIDNL